MYLQLEAQRTGLTGHLDEYYPNVVGKRNWNARRCKELLNWTESRGSACAIPFFTQQGNDVGEEAVIELIPYGCTTLRIAEFPVR